MKREIYTGEIKYMPFEGGFYGIITESNLKLLPIKLLSQYKQDGAIVAFSGRYIKDIKTIQQWGSPFLIEEIKLLSPK
ncbi:hypothetical protein [Pseudoalteromonas denitrificans]|uniref:Uncharacterized protein n=1 Tax=Pseudoalteromonas denitrificans DSM 6059 TaxID=1123010 RepID=A0A1I1P379_9GAMM|nr:hypothetical protein [Pseudoalteromonas denitrificans]SFD04404.1 hypothetical protein SAMN02745724_03288 [Pseudoalteromonas denitrificans DSM 6059]